MKASTRKDGSRHSIAPAWGGHISTGEVDGRFGGRDQHCESNGKNKSQHMPKGGISSEVDTDSNAEPPQTQQQPSTPQELTDFLATAQELDSARLADLEADRSHVQELKALVAEFTLKGCGGPREVFMAELLVQVRTARPMLDADVQ